MGAGGRKGLPYDESQSISRNGGRGKPLPYGFPEMTLELGRGAPWVSRRGIRIRPVGGPGVPPLQEREREPDPSSAPVCALGHLSLSPLPLRDIIPTPFGLWPFPPDRGNRPLDKGSRPPGGRLGKNKKGQVLDLSLITQRRNAVSQKISLLTFFFKESKGFGESAV